MAMERNPLHHKGFHGGLRSGFAAWSRRGDSNSRPAVYETAALPLSYVGVTRDRSALLPIEPRVSIPRSPSRVPWRPYPPMVPRSTGVTVDESRLAGPGRLAMSGLATFGSGGGGFLSDHGDRELGWQWRP